MTQTIVQKDSESPPAPAPRDLDRSLVHGIAWTGGVKWVTQLLSWATTLLVARILSPADFGLVGMAMVYLGLVRIVNEFGLGAAIIQRRHLDEERLARLGGLSVLLGVGFFLLSATLAEPVALFFGEQAVKWIIIVLSLTLVAHGWQVLPRSLLTRDLNFRKVAWIEGFEAVTWSLATLSFAVLGFGYWALVFGPVVGKLASTILAVSWRPHRLAWPRQFRTIAAEVAFASRVLVAQVTWYLYGNADFAIVGRVLGKGALGAYSIGWTMASVPVDRISALVGRVTPAVFATVQDDNRAIRRYLSGLTEALAFITFPASMGMALVADEFILAVLGETWRPAIMPLRLIALYAGFRSVTTFFAHILVATGHEKRNMQFNLLALLVLPTLFYIGTKWGTTGVAIGWIVGYPILFIPFFIRYTLQVIEMPARSYLSSLWPALSGTLVMTAAVLAIRMMLGNGLPVAAGLVLHSLIGALTYGAFTYAVYATRVRRLVRFVNEIRRT